jgi:hypothetical protein
MLSAILQGIGSVYSKLEWAIYNFRKLYLRETCLVVNLFKIEVLCVFLATYSEARVRFPALPEKKVVGL